jgi:hypothetical protein
MRVPEQFVDACARLGGGLELDQAVLERLKRVFRFPQVQFRLR